LSLLQYLIGGAAGALVGFSLGLVGGGGSILAVPLIVYGVGVTDPHIAIGTSALAVAANAAINLLNHARSGDVRWGVAGMFALAGVVGAWLGSLSGKAVDGQRLLVFFGLLMLVVAAIRGCNAFCRTESPYGTPGLSGQLALQLASSQYGGVLMARLRALNLRASRSWRDARKSARERI
jgi:hypothetical protein